MTFHEYLSKYCSSETEIYLQIRFIIISCSYSHTSFWKFTTTHAVLMKSKMQIFLSLIFCLLKNAHKRRKCIFVVPFALIYHKVKILFCTNNSVFFFKDNILYKVYLSKKSQFAPPPTICQPN